MPKCSVKNCSNNTLTTLKKDGVSYFRFPKNELEREKWRSIIAAERSETFYKPNNSSVVCSNHFSEDNMYYTKTGRRRIKKCILPIIEINMPTTLPENEVSTPHREKLILVELRKTELQKAAGETTQPSANNKPNVNKQMTPSPTSSLTSILDTPETYFYKKSLKSCQKKIELKNKQIQNLKKKNKRLMKRNLTLKEVVAYLKKKRFVDNSSNTE